MQQYVNDSARPGGDASSRRVAVDVIIPAYNEPPEAIRATVLSCLNQSVQVRTIYVVDDGSSEPIRIADDISHAVTLLRLPRNSGISAARNRAIQESDAPFLACVNVDVLLAPNWLEVCLAHLAAHDGTGVVTARTWPQHPGALLGRWRNRFQEPRYPKQEGPMRWAIAHALLFRAAAIKEVGCFDERFWKCGEDVDICSRLRDRGWEIFYVKGTSCRSIQEDSLGNLARAEFNRFCVERDFGRSAAIVTSRAFQRSIRHVLFGRVLYLPVEFGIWCTALQISWRKRSV